MKDKKFLGLISLMLIVVISMIFIYSTQEKQELNIHSNEYITKYFNKEEIMEINIEIDENELEDMFENAMKEENKIATVTVNGDEYNNVAVRPKGGSSLRDVSEDRIANKNRFSFKITFDEYIDGQTMKGLTQLNLNNNYQDPTYMREFIAYSIAKDMGLPTPEFAYARVSINGEYRGLYLAVESILEPYLENNFGDITGDLYKSLENTTFEDSKNINETMDIKSSRKDADTSKLESLVDALETNENIEKYLDVDSVLKNIAINTALLNMDSYQGDLAHNFYMYEQDGKFTMLPWDYNMAFGGYPKSNANIYIDEPTVVDIESRPLVYKLLENEKYKQKYYEYLQTILDKYLTSDYLKNMINDLYNLIFEDVKNDATAFFSFEEFEKNVYEGVQGERNIIPGILSLSETLSEHIQKQLNGEISTINENKEQQISPSGQMPPDGMERPKMPNGQMTPDGTERPEMPKGQMLPDGTERPEMPNGQMPPDKMERPDMPPRDENMKGGSMKQHPNHNDIKNSNMMNFIFIVILIVGIFVIKSLSKRNFVRIINNSKY